MRRGLDLSEEVVDEQGSFDCVVVRFPNDNFAQDDNRPRIS
jgi:hypothetical protein